MERRANTVPKSAPKGPPRAPAENEEQGTENPAEPTPLSPIRTVVVFAVIIACFAVVYPRFLHPMISYAFGGSSATKQQMEEKFLPPKFQSQHPAAQREPQSAMHMRPTHHPGARFVGSEQAAPESKGALHFMLPLYTTGIIAFLLFTFYKVLSKTNQTYAPHPPTRPRNVRYDPAEQEFVNLPPMSRREVLGDEPKMTEVHLRALEIKLAETEANMNALIEQMTILKSQEEHSRKRCKNPAEKEGDVSSESDEDFPSEDVNSDIAQEVRSNREQNAEHTDKKDASSPEAQDTERAHSGSEDEMENIDPEPETATKSKLS